MLRTIFWLHALIAGVAGGALYLFPRPAGGIWPWPLPALAARFVGALLFSGALYSGLTAAARSDLPIRGALLMATLLYGLIALVGVLGSGEIGLTPALLVWLAIFGGLTLLFGALLVAHRAAPAPAPGTRAHGRPQVRELRELLLVDLVLVAPVGLVMYLAPALARRFWPWDLTPINGRLIGSIFVATAVLTLWSLQQRTWEAVGPSIVAGGAFTTLALIASLIHFNLFDPNRLVTWLFVALYVIVAVGAWFVVWRQTRLETNV